MTEFSEREHKPISRKEMIEMTIRKSIKIDLTGPDGNAFYLMGVAKKLAKQHNKDSEDIINRMRSGDYENLLKVFEEEFGDNVILNKLKEVNEMDKIKECADEYVRKEEDKAKKLNHGPWAWGTTIDDYYCLKCDRLMYGITTGNIPCIAEKKVEIKAEEIADEIINAYKTDSGIVLGIPSDLVPLLRRLLIKAVEMSKGKGGD